MTIQKKKSRRSKAANIGWYAGLLFLLLAYWWVMANFVIRDFWDPQYVMKYEALRGRIEENPGRPLWLVMGSSRVERGLDPTLLSDRLAGKDAPIIYNFGLGGAGLFRQFICLRRLLEAGIKPQRVGIEIMGATLGQPATDATNVAQMAIRARESELNDYITYSDEPSVFLREWRRSRWDPAYKYGMKIPHQTLAWRLIPLPWVRHLEWVPYGKWGWSPQPPGPMPEAVYRANFDAEKKAYEPNFDHFKILPQNDFALRRMLEMCRSAGIKVFLLKMPEEKDFRAIYTPEANAMIDTYIRQIQDNYGVPLIDASTWLGKEGFTDGNHMDGTGAMEFTRRFGEELFALKL